MESKIVKEGFDLAQKGQREKQVEEVKKIATKTLERLEEVRKNRKTLEEEERILKLDIEDLKEGRLDRIVERQEKDPKAKQTSVVTIIREKEVIREVGPWYWPYRVYWNEPIYYPAIGMSTTQNFCFNTQSAGSYTNTANCGTLTSNATMGNFETITCSIAKDATVGTYGLSGGHIVHLR